MIRGKNVLLRSFELEDFDKVWSWLNDSDTMLYASSNPYLVVPKDQLIKNYMNPVNKKIYAVCTIEGELIGEASYWVPNHLFQSTVEIGAIIGNKGNRSVGYGFETAILLGEIIFNKLNIHRITMCISDHNYFSKLPLEKSWVKKEGTIRRERYIDGKYYDTIIYGLLRNEFYEFRERFKSLL